jgi:hypothetical protein
MLLFGRMSGTVTPDYLPPVTSWLALPASLAAAGILAIGLLFLIRERKYWWDSWLRQRSWGGALLGCLSVVMVIVMLTQRPRPSYLFVLGIALRAAIVFFCYVIERHLPRLPAPRWGAAAAVGLALLVMPARYARPVGSRLLLEQCRRLEPLHSLLERPDTVIVTSSYGSEVCNYLGLGRCRAIAYGAIQQQVARGESMETALDQKGVNVFSAGSALLRDPAVKQFFARVGSNGWAMAGMGEYGGRRWRVVWRPAVEGASRGAQ